jgi:hypothetical protein
MRGPNVGTGTSSGHGSAVMMVRWWQIQHDTSSDRTPFSRMLPSVIGSMGSLKRGTGLAYCHRAAVVEPATHFAAMSRPAASVEPLHGIGLRVSMTIIPSNAIFSFRPRDRIRADLLGLRKIVGADHYANLALGSYIIGEAPSLPRIIATCRAKLRAARWMTQSLSSSSRVSSAVSNTGSPHSAGSMI